MRHDLSAIRSQKPLIHHITNFVSMPICANALLALGASPIMAHAQEELEELLHISQALVINIGTLDAHWIASMKAAQAIALKLNKPIILDPVGSGASALRTQTAKQFLDAGVSIVRGNSSEIMSLLDSTITTKGVDSTTASDSAVPAAQALAAQYQCVVVVSGETDYIVSPDGNTQTNTAGTPLFTQVTAMGCAATSVIAAFAAINPQHAEAALHAMQYYGQVGERAAALSQGPGSFYQHLLDGLAA